MADVTIEGTLAVAERLIAAPLPQPERSELTGGAHRTGWHTLVVNGYTGRS
jgi:hypothetical protein